MNRLILSASAAVILAVGGAAFITTTEPETAVVSDPAFSLKVDLSERQLYVLNNGETVETYSVAIGAPSYPTPKGSFSIRRIVWNPSWVPPDSEWAKKKKARGPGDPKNPMGKVKIFFRNPDFYIHGTRDVDSLGQAESHGCIRMRNADVVALAKRVMANGGAAKDPSWYRRVVNRVTSTREVWLSTPVRLQIVG